MGVFLNRLYFNQRPSRRNVTPITDELINRLPKTKLFDSNVFLNNELYKLHQKLLAYSKNKNNCCEVGILWNYTINKYVIVKGTENGINLHENYSANLLLRDSYYNSLIFIHNHPKNSIFSFRDLHSFCNEDCIVAMTAVCNDGRIHILRKEEGFNSNAVEIAYNNAFEKGRSGIREVLNNASKLRLMYRCSVPRKGV